MPNFTTSPNMLLPIPVVGVDPGPDYAFNINSSLTLVDQHNHSTGEGVQINPAGLNINADLPINSNNLTLVRSVRFTPQVSPLALVNDLGCVYVSGLDLYYNDVNGNQVRITQGGSVAGTPGSITGLVAPASASYQVFNQTFVWQSAVNTAANMDFGAATFRNLVPSSFGITVTTPAALPADYTITLPATLPATMGSLNATSSGASIWVTEYDAVVGSSAQVTAGLANYSTITAALAAVPTNGTVFVLRGSFVENVTISATKRIVGSGVGSVVTGNLSFVGVDKAYVEGLKFTGNVTFDAATTESMIIESYVSLTSVVTDNGNGDYIQLTQG